ncbi:mitochondrial intermembrane space import and assembly protein 40 [[Candida] anglica]|uniref:Mitochondrial intermembrane space import and assembly protein 40 n=1 Tax=[Candida] anglica TaxID=148631 RepID=A0ABP0EDE9_9ASCO
MFRTALRNSVRTATRTLRTVPVTRTAPVAVAASAGLAWGLMGAAIIANDADNEKVQSDLNKKIEERILDEGKKQVSFEQAPVEDDAETAQVEAVESVESSADSSEESSGPSQAAAYNPETGEINWDCPCLGGMADGPCGEEFKEAFACFVYSETEPKGIDCIKKFENMRTCFRQYPEHYREELYEDEEPVSSAPDSTTDGAEVVVVAEPVDVEVDVVEVVEPTVEVVEVVESTGASEEATK